jgi:hypothetical protein
MIRPSQARAQWILGADGHLAFPSASRFSSRQEFETGVGVEARVGYRYAFGPIALRPEVAVGYTYPSFPITRALAGGRVEGTSVVAPFALARMGWGWVSYRSTIPFSTDPDLVRSLHGDGLAYQFGGGLKWTPAGPVEFELLAAYNGLSEPLVDDVPSVDVRWVSAHLGTAVRF